MNIYFIFIINVFLIQSYETINIHRKQNVIRDINILTNIQKVNQKDENAVKLTVFYENLNKENRKFVIEELKPAIDDLWDIIDLELVPFGNTNMDTLICPYGEKQCYANKIQSCAINLLNGTDNERKRSVAHFTYCMFKNREYSDIYELAPHCANEHFFDEWTQIIVCQQFSDGDRFYKEMGEKTKGITLVNGLAVQIGSDTKPEYTENLIKSICDAYSGDKPERCMDTEKAPKVSVDIYYETLNIMTQNYFSRQIRPFYHLIEEIVTIDLIPYGNTQLDTNNGNLFKCSSENECIANKIQALVVNDFLLNGPNGDEIDGTSRAINFISCMSSHPKWQNIYTSGSQCANQNLSPDYWIHLLTNATSSDSDGVFLLMRDKTEKGVGTPLPRVPIVTINGKQSIPTLNDFLLEVCAKYTGKKPSVCTRIEVMVYYESLNHKSRKFIIEELRPAFTHFQNLINLKLIPAGNSSATTHGSFECPAGQDQCDGNILQGCIIDYYWNDGSNWTNPIRQEVVETLYCIAKNKHAVGIWTASEQCSEQTIELDPWPTIALCAKDVGKNIFGDNIDFTQSTINESDRNFPVVTINSVVNKEAVNDLIAVLCQQFDSDHKPDKCFEGKASKVEVGVYYESMSQLSRNFFTKQMGPNYRYIEEMVDLQLYPNGNVDDSGNSEGQCPTQSPDCVANQIQAIVIDQLWSAEDPGDQIDGSIRTTQFLSCVFSHPKWNSDYLSAGHVCANTYLPNDKWLEILVETNTTSGFETYKRVQQKTKQLKDKINSKVLKPIPYVTLNTKHILRTANDLLQSVCDSYTGEKPLECTPVKVEIYYEVFSAETRKFIIEELRPTFEQIRESFTLEFIPYGTTNSSGSGNDVTYVCRNGEQQCVGNKIQACAVKLFFHNDQQELNSQIDGKYQTLLFIHCMFKNVDNFEDIQQLAEVCANQYFIDDAWIWKIKQCLHTDKKIMEIMAQKTLSLPQPLEHSPWIVINGERSALAQTQLQKVICDNLLGDRPDACELINAPKVQIEFHYQTADTKVRDYIINQLYPSYRKLEEIMDLEIVPFGETTVSKDGDDYTFTCPNGPNECMGNKIHTCIYEYYWHNNDESIRDNMDIDGRIQTMEFLKCYFSNENWFNYPLTAAKQCVEPIFGHIWSYIDLCVKSGNFDPIFAKLEEKVKALSPPLTYTPWITINTKHSIEAETHLLSAVCNEYYGIIKPNSCFEDSLPATNKIKVKVYYENLNKENRKFVIEELKSVIDDLWDIIELELVPFGNTNMDTLICPYGEKQCYANRIQSCAINLLNGTDNERSVAHFTYCMFKNREYNDIYELAPHCANEHFFDEWTQINNCQQSSDGDKYYKEMGEKTKGITLVDGLAVQIGSETKPEYTENLIKTICDAYSGDKPVRCMDKENALKVSVDIYYETLNIMTQNYFSRQIRPFYQLIEEIVKIDLIPYGNTKLDGNSFKCNSENQCIANKIQSLVVKDFLLYGSNGDEIDGTIRAINFISCMSSHPNWKNILKSGELCANQYLTLDYWKYLLKNINSSYIDGVFLLMKDKTEKTIGSPLPRVPTVTINGEQSIPTFNNFLKEVCSKYTGKKPSICNRMEVMVYYESLNQRSRKFIIEELSTAFTHFQYLINLKLIPAGNSKNNGNELFLCPKGQDQCDGNIIQGCIIDYFSNDHSNSTYQNQQVLIEILYCIARNKHVVGIWEASEQCFEQISEVHACPTIFYCTKDYGKGIFGDNIDFTQSTIHESHRYFPVITINGLINKEAVNDLIKVLCQQFDSNNKPEKCSEGKSPKLEVSVYYESMSQLSRNFFIEQLGPNYIYIEEMVDLKLYPNGNVDDSGNNEGQCPTQSPACVANQIQAIVIDQYWSVEDENDQIGGSIRTIQFLSCVFNDSEWNKHYLIAAYKCANTHLTNNEWLENLYTTSGWKKYEKVQQKTKELKNRINSTVLDPIPYITINSKHSERTANYLLQSVCESFTGIKPDSCSEASHITTYTTETSTGISSKTSNEVSAINTEDG